MSETLQQILMDLQEKGAARAAAEDRLVVELGRYDQSTLFTLWYHAKKIHAERLPKLGGPDV